MNSTRSIRDILVRQGLRLRALASRGASQVVAALPPMVILAKYGAGGAGLFAILIAVGTVSHILEWGFSYKLQNQVSRGEAAGSYDWHWFLARSGFPFHLAFNLLLGLAFCRYSGLILPRIFPPEVARVLEANPHALMALVLITAASAATYHARSIIFGLGHIDLGFLLALAGAMVSLVMVVAGSYLGASVTVIAVFALSTSLIERVLGCIYYFSGRQPLARHPSLPPPASQDTRPDSLRGWKVAGMFFYLQALSMVANNIDAIYAGRCRSLSTVGEFAFLLKLFGVPLLIVNVINTSSWPRLAVESMSGGRSGHKTLMRLLKNNLIVFVGLGLLIVLASEPLYRQISGAPGHLRFLALLMLLDGCFQVVRGVLTTYVNAAEVVWTNVIGNTVFSFAAIFLKVEMVDRFGINGLVLANLFSYLVFLLPFHWLAAFRPLGAAVKVR